MSSIYFLLALTKKLHFNKFNQTKKRKKEKNYKKLYKFIENVDRILMKKFCIIFVTSCCSAGITKTNYE